MSLASDTAAGAVDPLSRWGSTIEELTHLKKEGVVRQAYTALVRALNIKEFDGKLFDSENSHLIIPRSSSRTGGGEQPQQQLAENEPLCSRNIEQLVSE